MQHLYSLFDPIHRDTVPGPVAIRFASFTIQWFLIHESFDLILVICLSLLENFYL